MPAMIQGSLRLAALLAGALAVPATAQAATFTVDQGAAAGCTAERVCKTITDANAAVADGDVVAIKASKTPYVEPTIVVTRKNVTFEVGPGGAVLTTSTATPGAPIMRFGDGTTAGSGDGTVLRGIVLSAPATGGPAVRVSAVGTKVDASILVRATPSSVDSAALLVDDEVADGITTVSRTFVVNSPASGSGQAAAAVQGGAGSSLLLDDAVVVSGALQGAGVGIAGGEANLIRRSQILASSDAADGLRVVSAADSDPDKAVVVDSSIISGGKAASAVAAVSEASTLPGTDTAGDIALSLVHATLAGSARALDLDANSSGPFLPLLTGGGDGAGNITASVDRSILSGTIAADNNDGLIGGLGPLDIVLPANSVGLTVTNSDATVPAGGSGVTVTATGNSQSAPESLFRNAAGRDYHLKPGAPVIDQAGAQASGFSETDVDGQPRVGGPASDKGADEFFNTPPVAVLGVSNAKPKSGEAVTFDATKSLDLDGTPLASYVWTFGDGTTTTTVVPTVEKVYSRTGTFTASVAVVDAQGAPSPLASVGVTVTDGSPPVITSGSPKAGAVRKLYSVRTRVVRREGRAPLRRKVRTARRITLTGTASDPSGIKNVQIALRRVRLGVPKATTTPAKSGAKKAQSSRCPFYDLTSNSFKVLRCSKPRFFTVPVREGRFSYRLKVKSYPKIRAGVYEVIIRGTDDAGNTSDLVRRQFVIRIT